MSARVVLALMELNATIPLTDSLADVLQDGPELIAK